jgi:hypoxanthine phosphoribosyltransferase
MTQANLGNKVLLVDDLVDSGNSLEGAINWLKEHHGREIEEIRTAVIWYKSCSTNTPDYYVEYLADSPWIHQPFERYEQITPAELVS